MLDVNAQNARVQFIHNSPDTSLRSVDIYWNGVILYNNFVFHRASTFLNRPGNTTAVIAIADSSSTSANDAFATFEFTPAPSETYILVLQGLRNPDGYASYQPFDLKVIEGAREYGLDYATVDLMFVNGSPDDVDLRIEETFLMQVPFVESLSYGENTPYMSMFTGNYTFQLQDAAFNTSLGDFDAPFGQYGLNGRAVTILTSGFSNPSVNSNGPLLSMWMARAEGGMMTEFASYETTMCLLHNSPDELLDTVDVYWSGQRILDDFVFASTSTLIKKRFTSATVELAFAPSQSESVAEAFATLSFQPSLQDTIMLMLCGIQDDATHPGMQPLELVELDKSLLTEDSPVVKAVSGIVDLPQFILASETIAQNQMMMYGHLVETELLSEPQILTLKNAAATYDLGKWQWPNLTTTTALLIASGYNYHTELEARDIKLFAWNGLGNAWLALEQSSAQPCSVRFLNNSVEEELGSLDLYINEELVMSAMAFEASPVYELPAESAIEVAICRTGAPLSDALLKRTLEFAPNTHAHFMMDGFVNTTGYNPAPVFDIRETLVSPTAGLGDAEVGLAFYNGATDVGTMGIFSVDNDEVLLNAVPFGQSVMLDNDVNFTQDLAIAVRNGLSHFLFGNYTVPILSEDLLGTSVLIFSRGFWNPQHNHNGEPFGMWMMKENGTIVALEPYVAPVSVEEVPTTDFVAYPNPSQSKVYVVSDGQWVHNPYPFELYDAVGVCVLSGRWNGSMDISTLASGMYYLRINGSVVPLVKE